MKLYKTITDIVKKEIMIGTAVDNLTAGFILALTPVFAFVSYIKIQDAAITFILSGFVFAACMTFRSVIQASKDW